MPTYSCCKLRCAEARLLNSTQLSSLNLLWDKSLQAIWCSCEVFETSPCKQYGAHVKFLRQVPASNMVFMWSFWDKSLQEIRCSSEVFETSPCKQYGVHVKFLRQVPASNMVFMWSFWLNRLSIRFQSAWFWSCASLIDV
jgi:hypothetical protein